MKLLSVPCFFVARWVKALAKGLRTDLGFGLIRQDACGLRRLRVDPGAGFASVLSDVRLAAAVWIDSTYAKAVVVEDMRSR
jgi:hypothetical protein